ncbi:MAG: MarR family transcriptional regulator [Rhodanobacteraceae bacterium]|nr:MAG: MarR family transcriptional regulator [Rhodanobacteraceae bacterium]
MVTEVRRIRAFNRTVTRRLGVLNEKYLGRDRPYVESRLLFEIGTKGADVRALRGRLGMDSGFMSRLLRSLERKGLITIRPSPEDGRVRVVRLSRQGLAELRRIDALSDRLAQSMLASLTRVQTQRFMAAMSEVETLLRASSVEIAMADPASRDARHCLDRYFSEIDARFSSGFSRSQSGSEHADFIPPRGCMLVARLFGEPMGCGALRTLGTGLGEIKHMWISPEARGLGIGRRLLAELERVAKKHRVCAIRLDTNASLIEALRFYRSTGYREIGRYNDNPYAHHWFEKALK